MVDPPLIQDSRPSVDVSYETLIGIGVLLTIVCTSYFSINLITNIIILFSITKRNWEIEKKPKTSFKRKKNKLYLCS